MGYAGRVVAGVLSSEAAKHRRFLPNQAIPAKASKGVISRRPSDITDLNQPFRPCSSFVN
jgi:hypothetical protein